MIQTVLPEQKTEEYAITAEQLAKVEVIASSNRFLLTISITLHTITIGGIIAIVILIAR